MSTDLLKPPSCALSVLPDTERYKCRFTIRSASSDSVYMISFDSASGAGYWTCICRGNLRHHSCKHLEAMGRKGRKYGRDTETIKALAMRGQ